MSQDSMPTDGRIFVITGENGSGKTRWLQRFSNEMLRNSANDSVRLICLSGTVMDKFPLDGDPDKYAYFGRRTNNNMFSEIAPYRRLLAYIGSSEPALVNNIQRAELARSLLNSINLDSSFKIRFRRGRNSKEKVNEQKKENLDLSISLKDFDKNRELSTRASQASKGLIHISGVSFKKGGIEYDLMDLSSGERTFALTILALAFSVTDRSTVVFDEPENSLHPLWQTKIMKDMWQLITKVSSGSRIIVATHSPLMVSSASDKETYVLDMQSGSAWAHSSLYGSSADVVLKQQFGLESPRAMSFLIAVRNCVEALVTSYTDPQAFKAAAAILFDKPVSLSVDDPLYGTVQDIRSEWERIQ